jgi:ABC-type ATPase involved in cell division
VLVDVNLSIDKGELVVINGAAGSGKSTLVRLLLGLESPDRGWITVDGFTLAGASLAAHRRRLAIIPQGTSLISDLTALRNVALSLEVAGASRLFALRSAMEMLEQLGIERLSERLAGSLSSGEKQWVTIARALVREQAQLLIADEPAAYLDPGGAELLAKLLDERRRRGVTVIATSQQTGLPGLVGQRVVMLDQGRVALDSAAMDSPSELAGLAQARAS